MWHGLGCFVYWYWCISLLFCSSISALQRIQRRKKSTKVGTYKLKIIFQTVISSEFEEPRCMQSLVHQASWLCPLQPQSSRSIWVHIKFALKRLLNIIHAYFANASTYFFSNSALLRHFSWYSVSRKSQETGILSLENGISAAIIIFVSFLLETDWSDRKVKACWV